MTLFHQQLKELAQGKTIDCPLYDFETSDRKQTTLKIEPANVILVDGIFALYAISQLEHIKGNLIKLYVASDWYNCYVDRRAKRDLSRHARDEASTKKKEKLTVGPGFFTFVAPTRTHADYCISNNPTTSIPEIEQQLFPIIDDVKLKLDSKEHKPQPQQKLLSF